MARKFKLLKELPGIQSGEIIIVDNDGNYFFESTGIEVDSDYVDILYMVFNGDYSDFSEEIIEKKSFDELTEIDTVFFIRADGNIISVSYEEYHSRGELFMSFKDAEDEHKRREWANRKDKFIPEEGEHYFSYYINSGNIVRDINELCPYDIFTINNGLAFRTEKECLDAVDNNNICKLFYTIR